MHVPVGQRPRIPLGDRAAHRRTARRGLDLRRAGGLLRVHARQRGPHRRAARAGRRDGRRGAEAVPVAEEHADQRHRRGADPVRARRYVDEFRLVVRRRVDVQARPEDRPARLHGPLPARARCRRPVLRREGGRRLLELGRGIVLRAPQRLVVPVHGLWVAGAHRRLPNPAVPLEEPGRAVCGPERQPGDLQRRDPRQPRKGHRHPAHVVGDVGRRACLRGRGGSVSGAQLRAAAFQRRTAVPRLPHALHRPGRRRVRGSCARTAAHRRRMADRGALRLSGRGRPHPGQRRIHPRAV